ncbi:MAG: NAD(P)/FAD-dependent oxidoreductase [Deltaproteobacteria bacterium]|nr:NAD(P)/FAD-dependent oxidoreductase [Deltaproteobacteria bacterium]
MSEIEEVGSYDSIVIGAGMAGLVAANGLVLKGHRVLLLEKHGVVGGCTMNFERGDYRFEASTHVINGCEPGGMTYQQLARIRAEDRIDFIKVEGFGRMVDEVKGTDVSLPWELGAHVEVLVEQFPHEEPGIRSFYEKYARMAETLVASLGVKLEEHPELAARMPAEAEIFGSLNGRKAVDVLEEHVSERALIRMMLAIPTGFMGTRLDLLDAGSGIMCDLVFRINGGEAYYPKGGSGRMSQVLADLFVERGGSLLLNRGVTEIRYDDGRATGVIAKKRAGHFISADARCVVAASDLTTLVNQLCPAGTFPRDYVASVNERVPSISAVILFAGLNLDLPGRGITEAEYTRSWGKGPSPFGEVARECDFSRLPTALATIYSNLDPSCCPPGKSVVATMELAEPGLFESALGKGRQRGRRYKAVKERITAQLLEKMSRALGIPDLERHVEILELATPVTIERYTENRGGAYVGWRYSADQSGEQFPQASPVENLFLCGHWVAPGGGVSNVIAGGNNAAELAGAYLSRSA